MSGHSIIRVAPPAPAPPGRLGFGGAPLGDIFLETAEQVAESTLRAAWDGGVRYFDTAPWYGHGLSEHRLGTFLLSVNRPDVFVSTKVGRVYLPAERCEDARVHWAGGLNFRVTYDYTADGFAKSVAQSQMRLGTPSIDALVIHDLDRGYHGADFERHFNDLRQSGVGYLESLRDAGEISWIGMGINTLEDFEFMVDAMEVDFFLVAMPYTLMDQGALPGPMVKCLDRGIRLVIGAPFASGILADPENPDQRYGYHPASDEHRAKALALRDIAESHGVSLAAAALQFPLLHPAVQSVIPGAVTPVQARQNCANATAEIPAEMWLEMKAAGLISPDAPTGP